MKKKTQKKKLANIVVENIPVNDIFGKVLVSTDKGVKLLTALYPADKYKTEKAIIALAKKVLSTMIASGKISTNFLKQNIVCKK